MTRIRVRTITQLRDALRAGIIASDEWNSIVRGWQSESIEVEELSLEQYSNLSSFSSDFDLLNYVESSLKLKKVRSAAAFIARLAGIVEGIEKVQKAFSNLPSPDLSADELQAGYGNLQFGLFGIVDRIARRQGITDEAVKKMSVATVIGKLKIDGEVAACERRYAAIVNARRR